MPPSGGFSTAGGAAAVVYYSKRTESSANGLVLGFGSVPPRVVTESVKRLAAAIEVAA